MVTAETTHPVRVAILDLYNNEPNQGMRAIKALLSAADGRFLGQPIRFDVFETRYRDELPGLDYDVYISTGGPGSPFDGEGKAWEQHYFAWLDALWNHNQHARTDRKHALFICHSFQMMNRFFDTAAVTQRRSESFGIFPVHMTEAGRRDVLFEGLNDPFFAADFRKWQVVQPDAGRLASLGASILCVEKERPYVPLERAVMGIRISEEMVGFQFHPEADPEGMTFHFRQPEREAFIVQRFGREKYEGIMHRLLDPNYLQRTYDAVIPGFLRNAVAALRTEPAERH